MTFAQIFQAYWAHFRFGVLLWFREKSDIISSTLIYVTLIAVFYSVFSIMPMESLGDGTITRDNMFQYFMVTEMIVVSLQGRSREFGRLIAEGQLTTMMQRPCSMRGLLLTRLAGTVMTNMIWLSLISFAIVPLITGKTTSLPIEYIPFFVMSSLTGAAIFMLLGYCVGMLEVFGPYSRSFSWMVHKTMFTFGGLFFPVVFFPELFRKIAHFTPAPSVLFASGNYMLHPRMADMLRGFAEQAGWLAIIVLLVGFFEKRMVRRVMTKGD